MRIIPVILAAGASSRMGSPKALLTCGGRSFLSIISCSLGAARLRDAAVVVGGAAEAVVPAAEQLGLRILLNENWATGRMSSVRVAAGHASRANAALLLWPVDCPGVSEEALTTLVAEAALHPGANVVPSHSRRGGHPVILSPSTCLELQDSRWADLREAMISSDSGRRFVDVSDPAVLDNIDTPAQLEAFLDLRCAEGAHA